MREVIKVVVMLVGAAALYMMRSPANGPIAGSTASLSGGCLPSNSMIFGFSSERAVSLT